MFSLNYDKQNEYLHTSRVNCIVMYIILNKKEAQLISIALSIHYSILHTKYVLDFQFDPYFKKKKKKEYLQFRTLLII